MSSPATGAREATAARAVLALALGLRPAGASVAWDAVLAVAEREGCAPLCWLRSGALIRAEAPPDVRDAFRARAIAVAARAERQVAALAEVLATLAAADVRGVVLKGAPLAQFAHGDPFVRQSADIDVLVPQPARARAADALRAAGWRAIASDSPGEEAWVRGSSAPFDHLEVQGALLGDMLAHLEPAQAPTTSVRVAGIAMTVLAPEVLPAYLSVHLARHRLAPLLWFADLHAVWQALVPSQRAAAREYARAHGLHRYLDWGLRRADAARAAAEGDEAALSLLGRVTARGRTIGHPALRDVRLAPSAGALLRATRAWVIPPRVRADDGVLRGSARRIARIARRAIGAAPARRVASAPIAPAAPAVEPPARALEVDREQLETVLRAVVAEQGGSMWLRARGRSMHPTIRDGALVRLVPTGPGPLAAGRVVLARLGDGSWAMHRVVRETAAGVLLQGDATVVPDPVVARQEVLAAADAVAGPDGAPRPIPPRAPWTMVRLTRPLRITWWRLRARLRGPGRKRPGAACAT